MLEMGTVVPVPKKAMPLASVSVRQKHNHVLQVQLNAQERSPVIVVAGMVTMAPVPRKVTILDNAFAKPKLTRVPQVPHSVPDPNLEIRVRETGIPAAVQKKAILRDNASVRQRPKHAGQELNCVQERSPAMRA